MTRSRIEQGFNLLIGGLGFIGAVVVANTCAQLVVANAVKNGTALSSFGSSQQAVSPVPASIAFRKGKK